MEYVRVHDRKQILSHYFLKSFSSERNVYLNWKELYFIIILARLPNLFKWKWKNYYYFQYFLVGIRAKQNSNPRGTSVSRPCKSLSIGSSLVVDQSILVLYSLPYPSSLPSPCTSTRCHAPVRDHNIAMKLWSCRRATTRSNHRCCCCATARSNHCRHHLNPSNRSYIPPVWTCVHCCWWCWCCKPSSTTLALLVDFLDRQSLLC